MTVSDEEFDVLDELYFVKHFNELLQDSTLSKEEILPALRTLYDKGWIKVLRSPDEEILEKLDLTSSFQEYYYLATKKGLLAHNQI